MKRNVLAALALFALLIAAMSSPAMAEDNGPSAGPSNCVKFSGDQAAAQAYFEAGGGSANNNYEGLDDDGNGIACDEPGVFEGGGPSAGPEDNGPSAGPSNCVKFSGDQAAAQAYFEAGGGSANNNYEGLDDDGNGIACDEPGVFEGGGPSAHPTECAEFTDQIAAQTYFDAQGADYQNLDPDGNGIACDEPEASEQSGSDDSAKTDPALGAEGASTTTSTDDSVSDFPVTGSGISLPTAPGSGIGLLLGLSMIFGASALHGNRLVRR